MTTLRFRRSTLLAATLTLAAACDRSRGPDAEAKRVATPSNSAVAPAATSAPRHRAPAIIRGVYLNAYAAGSPRRVRQLLALADSTEINTFVIDVKDERGIRYPSAVPLARQLAQPGEVTIRDLKALVNTLHRHGLWLMARIVVFKDPILSRAKPEWSIRAPGGGLWRDRQGLTWVSAWDPNVWDYNLAIAEEVARLGFDEIQFDYVRFPEPFPSLPPQVHPRAHGDRAEAIVGFLREARRRLHPLGVVIGADIFGLVPNDPRDVNIGQHFELLAVVADHLLPMMYPSHYLPTHLPGVPRPNRMPYETVLTSAGAARLRLERLRQAGAPELARIIVWLQAFSAPWVDRDFPYGPAQARAQMQAVYDVGWEDWIFWHPGSRYDQIAAAFERELRPRAHRDPRIPPTAERLVAQLEPQGVRDARQRAVALWRELHTLAEAPARGQAP